MMPDVAALSQKTKEYIISQRRYLHAHPELGRYEIQTTKHIADELKNMGVEVVTFPDITGCIGVIKGKYPGDTVCLRANIDALPISECSSKPYVSLNKGVMHACGHDCHTAMLLGAAKILSGLREYIHGTVKLLFQMAEEIGTESRHYLENGSLDDVDAIFGMHVWSLLDSGTANFEDGQRMASSDRFTIRVHGKSAHGSTPERGADAIVAAAAIVMALQQLVSRKTDSQNTFVITVGMMNGGTQSNIIASDFCLVGTTRVFDRNLRKRIPELIRECAENVAKGYGCSCELEYVFGPSPLTNDKIELNKIARGAVTKVMGQSALVPMLKQMGAEDFAVYTEKIPAVFGFLGARNEKKGIVCAHHTATFDVDEDVLPDGTAIEVQFALDYLNRNISG